MRYIARALVHHAVQIPDKVMDARPRRIARGEEEHVEQEDGIVVEQVAEGRLGEVEGDGGGVGDAAHVGDAVDVGDDFLQREVPGRVDNVGELGLGDGNVPALDDGRRDVVREEFHVDGVCFVCRVCEHMDF